MSNSSYTCVRCYHRFHEPALMCLNPECVDHQNGHLHQTRSGAPQLPNILGLRDAEGQVSCPSCHNKTQFERVCPGCRAYVPEEFRSAPKVLTVALTGARNAGKTVYMVALVQTLREMGHRHGSTVFGVGDTDHRFEEEYRSQIYDEGQILGGTPRDRQTELIFGITRRSGETVFLVLRDVAGETIQDIQTPQPDLEYINNADLVTFLFDPYTLRDLMSELRHVVPSRQAEGDSGDQVISKILNTLISPDNHHTSFALLFSKFDVIQRLVDGDVQGNKAALLANSGLSFQTDDSFNPNYRWSEEETRILDEDVRSLMQQIDHRRTLQPAENAFVHRTDQLCTFAVSALGAPPHGSYISSSGVAPFRCADPLMWGFYRLHGEPLF